MSVTPAATSTYVACLHCSPARTVWLRRGEPVVEKVYVTGGTADAEAEFRMGQAAAGPGVVEYLATGTDPQTSRPTVTVRHHDGDNLEMLVARRGAIPAAEALELLLPVAHTLARLHGLRRSPFANGIYHGDVKPQNLLATGDTTLLIDFEHAGAIGSSAERAFTGGTSAWSPPEAFAGAAPTAAFDVFGLGATLAFLLDGGTARRLPRHPSLEELVFDCCNQDPLARPGAGELLDRCEQLRHRLLSDPAEQTLQDWASGACRRAPRENQDHGQRKDGLQDDRRQDPDPRSSMWRRRQRLLERLPNLLELPPAAPTASDPAAADGDADTATDPATLLQELEFVLRILARFPRSAEAVERRQQTLERVRRMLARSAAIVRELSREEQFDEATRWLRAADALVSRSLSLPGGLTAITRTEPGSAPGACQRAPVEFLQLLSDQIRSAEEELLRRASEVSDAERTLDLTLAEQRIDAMAADYGGTSKTVAERRDQLHRLGFYLDRIARSEPHVERIGPLWDPVALAPLQSIVAAAARALETHAHDETSGRGAVGLRSLQLTLTSVAHEFPHLQQVGPALAALSSALTHLTDESWQQLGDAEQRLRIVPVPVRPLQLALGRLDTFRILEVFVDRPERPRSELLDGLERLRLGLEQARSARDRLAENAEHALARGHWTTGLFDMERAVERLNAADDSERDEAQRLKERLQAARQTKRDIETTLKRNVQLTARYAELEDDPHSTAEARLRTLEERRDGLMFLVVRVTSDRAELYRKDLRAVESLIATERAADAERRLDALTEPLQRLRLARATVDALGAMESSEGGAEPSGRLVRLQEHWRTVAAQCQRAVDSLHEQRQQRERQRRRMLLVAVLAAVATTTAIGFALKPWLFGEPAMAATKTPR